MQRDDVCINHFELSVDIALAEPAEQAKARIVYNDLQFSVCADFLNLFVNINTFVSVTVVKNEDFQSNQVIRVLDQIGNDIAVLFNTKYLGKVQNNNAGRIAFWNDLVTYNNELQRLQAITDFEPEQLIVEQGESKKSVVVTNPVTPVMAMSKLYMTVIVN